MRVAQHRTTAGRHHAVRFVALFLLSGLLSGATLPTLTTAQSASVERPVADPFATQVAEASQRFGISERWIRAVMRVESAGRVSAVSSAGAMGLMQIMPHTWAGLRVRYRLGSDPFDPRDNIIGGTAYLREMYDRFGSPGFLAAYNAGPGRYEDHLATGRPLPRETRDYMAALLPLIGAEPLGNTTAVAAAPPDWREAPLFVEHSGSSSTASSSQKDRRLSNTAPTPTARDDLKPDVPADAPSRSDGDGERTP